MVFNLILWSLVSILYAPLILNLYRMNWKNIDYTHAYFILPVSLFLVWRMRRRLQELFRSTRGIRFWNPNILLIALGLYMYFLGWLNGYNSLATLSLIPFLLGTTAYVYGPKVQRALWFPIHYLLLMVPPPLGVLDSITLPMRYGVSIVSQHLLKMLNYPISREGLNLIIGTHQVYMGAPCSGFRSLITMISLGLVYAYLSRATQRTKVLLVVSVIPLALAGNLLRVMGICLVTYHLGDAAGHTFHDTSGYAIFLVLIFAMMGIESGLNKLR